MYNYGMKKALMLITIGIFIAAVAIIYVVQFRSIHQNLPEAERSVIHTVQNVIKDISAPGPLVKKDGAPSPSTATLTADGVLRWTNTQRQNNGGLPALSDDTQLNVIAALRLKDMFDKQYFAHVSPLGESASTLADAHAYTFIAIGENIALGNFDGDKGLVQAWMDSPGHRANILSHRFNSIGVAVGQGVFEGQQTWIGVQVFSLPLATCPQPDEAVKASIESLKKKIEDEGAAAAALRQELDGTKPKTPEEQDAYNKKARQYNSLVQDINDLVDQTKKLVTEYNGQVDALNACIAKTGK